MGKGVPVTERKLTAERMKELLAFDEGTGVFRWRQRRSNVAGGSVAGRKWKNGYVYIRIDSEDYLAGRLAWLWTHGKWPVGVLRYADKDKSNNRPENLYDATVVRGKHNWRTKEGLAAYQLEYRSANRQKFRDAELQRKFGMSGEEYRRRVQEQGNVCAVCGNPETTVRYGRVIGLTVDHNHVTNAVRELLCTPCNVMIGMSREKPEILEKAAAYLRRHST